MIDVTAAIIINKGKVLVAQRKIEDDLSLKWEFPGGKVEQGETPEECIVREIDEETGIQISVVEFLCESIYHYSNKSVRLMAYICKYISGSADNKVHNTIKWVGVGELNKLDFAPADIPIVEKLISEPALSGNTVIIKMGEK